MDEGETGSRRDEGAVLGLIPMTVYAEYLLPKKLRRRAAYVALAVMTGWMAVWTAAMLLIGIRS